MDLPEPAEGALAHPTRARVFGLLVERRGPAGTDELAADLGLHPNGVRRHLERLEQAGMVIRSRVRKGQGRPRDSWTVAADARPGGEPAHGYADLAGWLARAMPSGDSGLRQIEQRGREIGRELAPAEGGKPVEAFRDAFAALGFEPVLAERKGGFSCRLENCPYKSTVRERADVVCTLHRGITAGLLEVLDADASLDDFQPRDPEQAGCLVEVSGGSKER